MSARYFYGDQMALFGESRVVGFGTDEFRVAEIHRDQANAIVRRNHYSRKIYLGSFIHLGVYIAGALLGVLQFGSAMNPASQDGVVAGTGPDEYLELNRMWIDDFAPRNTESRAIGYSIKYIRRAWPKIRWIQSFADERCRLFGTVYQACNFAYYGEHESTFYELDGEVYHNSMMTRRDGKGGEKVANLQANAHRAIAHTLRQFRYIYFMAPRFKKGVRLRRQHYPKPNYAAGPSDEPAPAGESGAQPPAAAPASDDDG